MNTYTHTENEKLIPRSHPWTQALSDPTHRYYDLTLRPDLIRTSLEDILSLSQNVATEAFYELLEWLNGPESELESNDCGASKPHPNGNTNISKNLEGTVRLMILFRHLPINLSHEHVQWLEAEMQRYLTRIDPHFEHAVVGTTIVPTNYITLPIPEHEQKGYQLKLYFWGWGDDEGEVMSHLARSFKNVNEALIAISRYIKEHP